MSYQMSNINLTFRPKNQYLIFNSSFVMIYRSKEGSVNYPRVPQIVNSGTPYGVHWNMRAGVLKTSYLPY